MNILRNIGFLLSAVVFATLIAVGPSLLWPLFILMFIFLEKARIKRYGFNKIGFAQLGIIGCIVAAAYFAPLKYLDHVVNPADLEFHIGKNGSLLSGDRVFIYLPAEVTEEDLNLGQESMSLRSLISTIENATGFSHMVGYCGNGANLLYGGSPMGRIRFYSEKSKN